LTEQLLGSIRTNRAKVVVIDITGVQAADSRVTNHIVQTIEAAHRRRAPDDDAAMWDLDLRLSVLAIEHCIKAALPHF
jgi:hypothetical protein